MAVIVKGIFSRFRDRLRSLGQQTAHCVDCGVPNQSGFRCEACSDAIVW